MNIEDFSNLLIEVRDAASSINLSGQITSLHTHINNMNSNPQEPTHQNSFRTEVRSLLDSMNQYPLFNVDKVTEKRMEEYGLSHLIGTNLLPEINKIIYENQLTPATLGDEWGRFVSKINGSITNSDNVIKLLQSFNVSPASVESGYAEVTFVIPRTIVNEEISKFSKEVTAIEKLLKVYIELATGSGEPLVLKTISCSDYTITLKTGVASVFLITIALGHVFDLVGKFQDLLIKAEEIRAMGISNDIVEKMLEEVKNKRAESIEIKVGEILEVSITKPAEDRNQEIQTALKKSLEGLVEKVEKGFSIAVKPGEIQDLSDEDEEVSGSVKEVNDMQKKISDMAPKLREKQIEYDGQKLIENQQADVAENEEG